MRQAWPAVSKFFFGTSRPGENAPKILFLKPNPLLDGMIAQDLLNKQYNIYENWAYLTPEPKYLNAMEL